MPGQVARRDDGVIGVVGDAELAQLPLHGIGRPRRVGDQDNGAALLAVTVQRLAGLGKESRPLWTTPQISKSTTSMPPTRSRKLIDKMKRGHVSDRLAWPGGTARQRGIAGRPRRRFDAGLSIGSRIAGAIGSCGLVAAAPPGADAPSGRNGRGGANRKPWPNRTS